MRIEQLVLKRYGHFTDFSLNFSSDAHTSSNGDRKTPDKPDLHILYGPNEAGKSTTLAGITDLLYGFDRVTPWKFLHGNELLEIEASLKQSAKSVTIKRFKNSLTNSTNEKLASFPLDLQGLSRDEYRQRFSFDEKTLQEGGEQILNSQGDVGQALFSASSGLADFSNRLEFILAPSKTFWTPGKKTKLKLIELKKALQENKSCLNNLKLDVKVLQSRQSTLDRATVDLAEARQRKSAIADSIKTLEGKISLNVVAHRWMQQKRILNETLSLGIVKPSDSLSLDVSSESKINLSLDEIRKRIQDNQISESRLSDLSKQLLSTRKLNDLTSLNETDRLYLNTKEAIHNLTDSASAAIEWEHQQRELTSELELNDVLIREHSLAIGLSNASNNTESLPNETQLDSMTQLLSERLSVNARLNQAQNELTELNQQVTEHDEASEFVDETEKIDIVADVLRRVLHENLIEQYKGAVDAELKAKDELFACASTLGIEVNKIDDFQLPDGRMVFSQLDRLSEISHTVGQLTNDAQNAENEVLSTKQQISELISLGTIDEATFKDSLAIRDSAWMQHDAKLVSKAEYSELIESAQLFQNALYSHDDITTKTLTNGKQQAELKLLEQQLSRQTTTANDISKKLSISRSELEESTKLTKLHIAPFYFERDIDNDLVREKLNLAIRLKELYIHSANRCTFATEIKKQCDMQKSELLRIVSTIEGEATLRQLEVLELQDLIYQVEKSVDRKRNTVSELKTQVAERNLYNKNLDRTKGKIAKSEQELNDWQSRWESATRNTVMCELDADSARDKIPVTRKLIDAISRKNDTTRRHGELTSKIENRNQTLASILSSLGTSSIVNASSELTTVLEKVTESSQHLAHIKTTESNIAEVTAEGHRNKDFLNSLCKESGADNPALLIELLKNTAKYRAIETRCSEYLAQMTQITGEEQTIELIELFIDSFNTQDAQTRQAELATDFQQSESLYDECYRDWVLADKELREIGDNNDYAKLQQERANILLEIEEGAKSTAVALIGERVLKTAISKFRQEHQSVLLTEAQQAFSTLTLGKYTQLIPRDDDKGNERLFAIDKNNMARAVEELSTGTRYQLYLALRAAAHADYARVRTPLPFVADDIMESFDDERSAAAFEVLGKMAVSGQVLYMTHHQHLVPIAQQVLGKDNVTVHQLGQ